MLTDGAEAETDELSALKRTFLIFDGRDDEALNAARADWKRLSAAGLKALYWAETESGGWVKKAESKSA